jgi:O-methyltransferase
VNSLNTSNGEFPPDYQANDISIISAVAPYTMTSIERIHALISAVRHIVGNCIPGDFVECGVWKGGSIMAMALTLIELQRADRALYLFDTFAGMTPPGREDVDYLGQNASQILDTVRCLALQEEVEAAVSSTGYDRSQIHFVKGRVEETIPGQAPESIALLRLDTDWYQSTRHELNHLFPRLVRGGIIIIDDYGHWQGARRAVDEYLREHGVNLVLCRIDYTGRIGIKM